MTAHEAIELAGGVAFFVVILTGLWVIALSFAPPSESR